MKPVFRYSFAGAPAARRVISGESLTVEFPDSDGLGPDLHPLPDKRFEHGSPDRGNPVFGPILVEGAEPGDALRVHFLHISPDRKIARTFLGPDHGFLPDTMLKDAGPAASLPEKPRHMYLWELDGRVARVTNPLGDKPVVIPTHPFLGCVATASLGDPPLSTLLANNHGGNIDHPDLVEGTSLWLPVSLAGGMLYLGDMHAAQGHGETAGGGLEISGSATVRIELCKKRHLKTPRYQTPRGVACLAVEKNMETASRAALAGLTHWVSEAGWNIYDANMLINQTCEFRLGGITDKFAVVSCFMAKQNISEDLLSWP